MAKSSKSARSDRQKVIDDIRKKQRSAEKRQGTIIVTVCVIIAVAIIAAAAYRPVKSWIERQKWKGKQLAEIGAPASVCDPVITRKGTGVQNHVDYPKPVHYDYAPPAFGPHWLQQNIAPVSIDQRFYTASDRPQLEALVHNLEHGYTILWYDETVAKDDSELSTIKALASILSANDTNNRLAFKAVPWTPKDEDGKSFPKGEHVALTHWVAGKKAGQSIGIWQYCSEPSGEALSDFMDKYPYTDAPEPIGAGPM